MLWISKLFSSNTRRPSEGDGSQSEKNQEAPGYLVCENVSQTGTSKATPTQHYSQDAGAWSEPGALWVLTRPTGDDRHLRV